MEKLEEAGPIVMECLFCHWYLQLHLLVKATPKKKLDKEFRKYVILGACNPPYAYRSLNANLDVGLLLPCNVIVYETDDKKAYIAAVNPISALEPIQSPELTGHG